jgi:hypothetical protein
MIHPCAYAPAGIFLDPPRDVVAQHPTWPLVVAAAIALASLIVGIAYTMRTRSPLYVWLGLSGILLYPFVVEPIGDYFVAVWYATNLDIAATPFGRPIPWFAVFFYGGGIPLVSVGAHWITKRLPPARLLAFVGAVSVLEVPIEIVGNHLHWMTYYANPATIGGVPIYCWVQNGGMFVGVAWVLAWLLPRTHGWRWGLVPFAVAALLPVYAIAGTWPAYLAIHLQASDAVIWAAAIVSTVLNAAIIVWLAYSPTLRRLRETHDSPGPALLGAAA